MKQRMIALALTLTLLLAAAVSAFAVEPAAGSGETTPAAETQPAVDGTQGEAAPEEPAAGETTTEETTAEKAVPETAETLLIAPAPAGKSVGFYDLEDLVKKNNLTYQSLDATIGCMLDLEETEDTLESSIQQLMGAIAALDPTAPDYAAQATYLERNLAEAQQAKAAISPMIQDTTQMEGGQCQLIYGAESLYIALVGMERQEAALERQLASLDRTLEELEVRARWGQVSQLQLKEAESGRSSLASGLATLRMNITSYKMKLEQMIGEEPTGTLVLSALPVVSADQLSALNSESDLKQAKRKNFDLQAASVSEGDAMDAAEKMATLWSMVDAARYATKEAEQQVELKFQLLNLQLQDQQQALTAAETALETEQLAYQAQELKYQQGTISENALLTAEDELKTAQEAVLTAQDNLFSTYNNYRWAVDHGLLN